MPTSKLTDLRPSTGFLRLGLVALVLGAVFAVSAFPAPSGPPLGPIAEALTRGADRLVALQNVDGSWPAEVGAKRGPGDIAMSGRPARALLAAHAVTGDARYLAAALRTAHLLTDASGPAHGHVATTGNLIFLAEVAAASKDEALTRRVVASWQVRLSPEDRFDGARAGARFMERANPSSWLDGTWRNYLLGRAAEEAHLARSVGQVRWADDFTLAAARSWAPKHDYEFWCLGAATMMEALGRSRDPAALRLAGVERGVLEANLVRPGLSWNVTPYDTYVHASEATAQLSGMLASPDASFRMEALDGVSLLASRQSPRGGWGSLVALFDQVAAEGADDLAPADDADGESAELDGEIVMLLARAVTVASEPVHVVDVAAR